MALTHPNLIQTVYANGSKNKQVIGFEYNQMRITNFNMHLNKSLFLLKIIKWILLPHNFIQVLQS
jgi:alpha-tubulin suppressor-like RCC1 family protein